jgi:hypothetical protein
MTAPATSRIAPARCSGDAKSKAPTAARDPDIMSSLEMDGIRGLSLLPALVLAEFK